MSPAAKGFIPLHCASYCFLNSPKYIELVGAQFQRHGTGTFRTILAEGEHPIMRGFGGFESWDETYVHTKHNEQDRTVLEYRQEGDRKEPWTWVRTHGKGRVFYTAWGHDQRTWGNPGFQNLVERGIRWAVGADPGVVPAFTRQPPGRLPALPQRIRGSRDACPANDGQAHRREAVGIRRGQRPVLSAGPALGHRRPAAHARCSSR